MTNLDSKRASKPNIIFFMLVIIIMISYDALVLLAMR